MNTMKPEGLLIISDDTYKKRLEDSKQDRMIRAGGAVDELIALLELKASRKPTQAELEDLFREEDNATS